MTEKSATWSANAKNAEAGKTAYEQILEEFSRGPEINTALLMKILDDNKDTEYGRKYGFAGIRSAEDYMKKVPVIHYSDIRAEIEKMAAGEQNILTAYPYNHFTETSATTGPRKMVPLTQEQANVFMKYNKLYVDGLKEALLDPAWMEGRAFCTTEGRHRTLPNGITVGYASSVMAKNVRGGASNLGSMMETVFSSPIEATLPGPDTDTRYLHTRFALMDKDLTGIITGFYSVPTAYLKYIADNYPLLIDDIETGTINEEIRLNEEARESLMKRIKPMPERAAELREIFKNGADFPFIPRVWPKMIYINGAGGDGFSVYDRIIKEKYSGGCLKNIYDGVNASEGLWSVPSGIDIEDSIMAPDSAFFEFLLIECGDDYSKCLTMADVEAGRSYELIITNLCGFYRYRTDDVVEVTGFRGATPTIRFMYRRSRIINMVGEKTTEKMLQQAVEAAMADLGLELSDFSFYPDSENFTYVFLVEPMKEDVNVSEKELADVIRKHLCALNPFFAEVIDMERLSGLNAYWLQPQTMMLYLEMKAFRGASINQTKPVRVIINEEQKKFFFNLIMR